VKLKFKVVNVLERMALFFSSALVSVMSSLILFIDHNRLSQRLNRKIKPYSIKPKMTQEGLYFMSMIHQFSGTLNWYRTGPKSCLVNTDGIEFLIKKYDAYWLTHYLAIAIPVFFAKEEIMYAYVIISIDAKTSEGVLTVYDRDKNQDVIKYYLQNVGLPIQGDLVLLLSCIDKEEKQFCLCLPSED